MSRTTRTTRIVAVAATSMAFVGLLSGCSTPRSVEAYCATMEKHKDLYLSSMSSADAGSLGGLLTAAAAIGDLKIMWTEMADVAPEDIRVDTEAVRDAWVAQEKAATEGDLLGALAGGLMNIGSMTRVDQYVRDNCDAG